MTEPTSPDVTELKTALLNLVDELREHQKLKYMGDCKCGDCQLVPLVLLARAATTIEAAEAALRLATQRREDVVEALRGLDITDAELLRIRNNCELVDQNGMIEIWAMMLQKLVDHVRDLRALALQPKEN